MSAAQQHRDRATRPRHTGRWIVAGLLLGILCGVSFGEYCGGLQVVGTAYVGLLQMTVLPYLVLSLIAKMGRLDAVQAGRLGFVALVVLLALWIIGIVLIVVVSAILPPVQGASFYHPAEEIAGGSWQDVLLRFIPANVFRSLSDEYVPAVVVFCLLFGAALMMVPGKDHLLELLELCSTGISRINQFLVRLAPLGLFTLTAAAAGTLRLEQLSRLQAYLIMFGLACLVAAAGILPGLVSSLTATRYREFLRAAYEPILIALATGKLFVVLPQIVDKCEQLLGQDDPNSDEEASTASVLVPLAYPFPHLGKTLAFVFISFAAWYTGQTLTPAEAAAMAATGTLSSFASPLVTMPYLLDRHQLPQDLMSLFILPGFITTRIADVVGVLHLMALTVIATQFLRGRMRVHRARLGALMLAVLLCVAAGGLISRSYLAATTLAYDLDRRLLSLKVLEPHGDVVVYREPQDVPKRPAFDDSTLARVRIEKSLRVGYSPDRMPYCFFNQEQQLVGLDVELLHRLAARMQVRLEFVPCAPDTVEEQLADGEIDLVVGGVVLIPERFARVGFTRPYQSATIAVVTRDHRRDDFATWEKLRAAEAVRLGAIHDDVAAALRSHLPAAEVVVIDSFGPYFAGEAEGLDGLVMAAEVGSAWNILHPAHTVVVPEPAVRRPVGMAVRAGDLEWQRFLDLWLEFERLDGALDRLSRYWLEGGGTRQRPPRWCLLRDVLHWLP